MRSVAWKLTETMALQLSPKEREIVLGDLIEMRETAWRGFLEILELVARHQLRLWTNWRPWLAAPGLALPCSFLLMGLSFGISSEVQTHFLHRLQPNLFSARPPEIASLSCQVILFTICAGTAGFVVDSVSRRTIAASAICCLLPCLFCLLRFHQPSLSRFCLLIFLVPAIAGVCFSRRGSTINRDWAFVLALAATICMGVLAIHGHLWPLNWVLIMPAWYLAIRPVQPDPIPHLRNESNAL